MSPNRAYPDHVVVASAAPLGAAEGEPGCFISAMASCTASTFSATFLAISEYDSPNAAPAPARAPESSGPNFSLRAGRLAPAVAPITSPAVKNMASDLVIGIAVRLRCADPTGSDQAIARFPNTIRDTRRS